MKLLRSVCGAALMLVALGAWAQSVTFFERAGMQGRTFSTDGAVRNFARIGFNDRASSVIIQRGRWQLCTNADYRGNCVTLSPGTYPDLGRMGLSRSISSARPIGGGNPPPNFRPPPPPPPPPMGGQSSVTLFEGFGLNGQFFDIPGNISNMGNTTWNDRAHSMIVRGGRWQLCSDANFTGFCQTFSPGRYDDLGRLGGTLSSLRQVR
jgi:hypothetical protein